MAVVVAIDAGTTGVRAFAVDESGAPVGWSYREFPQHFPRPGWVEHDPLDILDATRDQKYRAVLLAWSDIRTRHALERDEHGRYWRAQQA